MPTITVSDDAAKKIHTLVESMQKPEHGLRVKVVGGGCSGLQYKMDVDMPRDGDKVFENACAGCGVVSSAAARESDYFSLFGLPHKLTIDLDDLGARYYALSRRFHPDVWHDSPPAEREASVRATAIVNNAYQALKDPVRRA